MDDIVSGLERMLHSIDNPLKNFKKNTYETIFRDYQMQYTDIILSLENQIKESINEQDTINAICEEFVSNIDKEIQSIGKKREIENKMMDYNLTIVAYLCPSIIDANKEYGLSFSKQLIASWKKHFPKTNLNVASFEEINEGFKKRYCYITTAVCESLDKPDDCYELTLLRDYRDGYLLNQEDGEKLIQCYYDIAPTIVKHINHKSNSHDIYVHIWERYLKPCINAIENGDDESCKVLYTKMVYDLQDEYFIYA